MATSALLLGLLSVFGIAVTAQNSDVSIQTGLPSFCGSRDCPKYQLIKQYDDFEHRQYEETRWVTTSLEQDMFGISIMTSFRRLFKYISGANADELKINMTVPVVMSIPLTSAAQSTMSFFVPHYLEKSPLPTDPEVHLASYPAASIYVKTFGGYALGYAYEQKAKALAEELQALGLQFDDTYYARVGYNDPFTFIDRHNEVWYMAK